MDWSREELNKRIDKRVDDRFQAGMIEEVKDLLESGVDSGWLVNLGLEYRIITLHLLIQKSKFKNQNKNFKLKIDELIKNSKLEIKNFESFETMSKTLKLRSHQYAKRQMTWFKRFPEIIWESDDKKINQLVKNYLN